LNIDINSNIAMVLNYSIINVLWQKISNGNINLEVGENSPTLEILETKGTYFISFYNENIFVKVIFILVE
jgi:hypothetical protein